MFLVFGASIMVMVPALLSLTSTVLLKSAKKVEVTVRPAKGCEKPILLSTRILEERPASKVYVRSLLVASSASILSKNRIPKLLLA